MGEFAETYATRFKSEPTFMAGTGYDAVMLASDAIERAGTTEFEAVAAAAARATDLRGAFGYGTVVREAGPRNLHEP